MLRALLSKLDRLLAVRLDDSSKLIKTSRDEYKYIEGDHKMLIYVDFMGKEIHENSIDAWMPPYAAEKISDAKRKEILNKICKFFEDRHKSYKIIPTK
jgi:hypothetical protein